MKVIYFGEIADKTKKISEVIEDVNSVETLVAFLLETYGIDKEDIHIAVNHELVNSKEKTIIEPSDEIAVLSPFAGG